MTERIKTQNHKIPSWVETFSPKGTHISKNTDLGPLDKEALVNFSLVEVHMVDDNSNAPPRGRLCPCDDAPLRSRGQQ